MFWFDSVEPPLSGVRSSKNALCISKLKLTAEIISTPFNRGSASVSEHFQSVNISKVSPNILADIENHSTCQVKPLLTAFLNLCLPKGNTPPSDLLEQCLTAVLPICNQRSNSNLHYHLTQYCQVRSDENARYPEFVLAFNDALRQLNDLPDLSLRPPQLDLLFHTCHPKPIIVQHNNHTSKRTPDIVLVSRDTARSRSKDGEILYDDEIGNMIAPNPPHSNFSWGDIYSSCEFNLTKLIPQPLDEYDITLRGFVRPQPTPTSNWEPLSPKDLLDTDTFLNRPLPSSTPWESPIHSDSKSSHGSYRTANPSPTEDLPSVYGLSERVHASTRAKKSNSSITSEMSYQGSHRSASSSSSPSSSKRKSLHIETSSKRPKISEPIPVPKKIPAVLQCALYAAERLSHALWISHVINLVVIDEIAYVWWYDKEGAIQSHGINFVQDLPYFLVLLLALQRFSSENWGIISTLKQGQDDFAKIYLPVESSSIEININSTRSYSRHGLVGRTTQVLHGSSVSSDPRDSKRTLTDVPIVVKIYWPEEQRAAENVIIQKAQIIGETNSNVKNHIPDLIYSCDFPEYSTSKIRLALGIDGRGSHILRVIPFRELSHITELKDTAEVWRVFWECFTCHYHLWIGGIEHRDISESNLMYDKLSRCGVLNDFDLSRVKPHDSAPHANQPTGTLPFMALDLLTEKGWRGEIEHLYRHDFESFVWVLAWICSRYEGGQELARRPRPMSSLKHIHFKLCRLKKLDMLYSPQTIEPSPSFARYWFAVLDLLYWIDDLHRGAARSFAMLAVWKRLDRESRPEEVAQVVELLPAEVFAVALKTLQKYQL